MLRHFQNKEGVIYDENNHKTLYAEDLNNLNGELQTMHSRLNDIPPRAEANQIIEGVDAIAYVNPLALKESENAHLKDINTPIVDIHRGFGSKMVSISFGVGYPTGGHQLYNSELSLYAIHIKRRVEIRGVGYQLAVAGNFTGQNDNAIGLYNFDQNNINLIARTENNKDIWEQDSNIPVEKDFLIPITLEPGNYYIGLLYSGVSEITIPSVASSPASDSSTYQGYNFVNGHKMSCVSSGHTTLPTQIDAFTTETYWEHAWLYLYE